MPASGIQTHLRTDRAHAVIGQVAAVLRHYSADGVDYVESWPDSLPAPMGAGTTLAPWPGRVAGGTWIDGDEHYQLDLTEPGNGNAIHGLLRAAVFQPRQMSQSRVRMRTQVYPQRGYPYSLDVVVDYELIDTDLRVTYEFTNIGARRALVGVGAHPYLRVGHRPVESLTLTIEAGAVAIVDERMIPRQLAATAGTDLDMRSGIAPSPHIADVVLTGLTVRDGRSAHSLVADSGDGIELWADQRFRWLQIYVPSTFPRPQGPGLALAIEPMTCGPNALNTKQDLIEIRPAETWSGSWGLRPIRAGH